MALCSDEVSERISQESIESNWGSGAMLKRAGLVKACLLGAVLNASALFAGSVLAQQGCCEGGNATGANAWTEGNATSAQWPPNPPPAPVNFVALPVKAPPPAVEAGPYWWTHGEIEIGGRDFVNNPNKNGSLYGNVGTAPTGTPAAIPILANTVWRNTMSMPLGRLERSAVAMLLLAAEMASTKSTCGPIMSRPTSTALPIRVIY